MREDDEELSIDLGDIFRDMHKDKKGREKGSIEYEYTDEDDSEEFKEKNFAKKEIKENESKKEQKHFESKENSEHKEKEEKHSEAKDELSEKKEPEKNKEDDEVSLDFGSFFGRKKKEDKTSEEKKEAHNNEEKKEKHHKEEEKEDEEVSFDFGKIKNNIINFARGKETEGNKRFRNYADKAVFFMLLIIPLILCIGLRMQPDYLPATDQWARSNIHDFIRQDIANVINSQYPNLPDANKNKLIDDEVGKAIQANSYTIQSGGYAGQPIDIQQQISANSNQLKEFFKDENGVLYTPDIDPYYWERYAENIIKTGHPGDEIKNNQEWDNHQLAPNGRAIGKQDLFHPYFLALFYKAMHTFNNKLTPMRSTQYYPVLVSSLIVLIVFFIANRIAGKVAGFFAATLVALHPAMLNRTLFGHADSDTWVVFFSVLIVWLFFEAFESKNRIKQIILSSLAGLGLGLYAFAWSGWWFVFDFILLTVAAYIAISLFLHRKELMKKGIFPYLFKSEINDLIIITLVFVISSGIFVIIFRDIETLFVGPFLAVIGFTNLKAPLIGSIWPNVLTTVAELSEGSVQGIIDNAGGTFLFYFSAFGILLALLKKDKEGNFDPKYAILLAMWFIGTVYASTKGIRFILLLIPALSIAFGVSVGMLHSLLTRWVSKELHIEKIISGTIFMAVFLLLFFVPQNIYGGAEVTAQQDVPLVNDAWYNSLKAIKEDSQPSAIITSWWDFGHHFKYIADRPVTFDGTTQDQPQAHWVGLFLMTDNERQAIGILRMLDCGGNNAADTIDEITNDTVKSVRIIKDILELDKEEAKKVLTQKYGINNEAAEKILGYSHCNPPEGYVIASEDMIGKSGVWAHFGSWNFERAAIWENARGMRLDEAKEYMKKELNYTDERAESMYYEVQALTSDNEANGWISPWPSYAGNIQGCSKTNEELIQCANGVNVNLTTNDAFFATAQGTFLHPASYVYLNKTGVFEKKYEENIIPQGLSAAVIPIGGEYISILSSPELANSMFTRLFYMRGHGLKYFHLLTYQRSITGSNIFVWKADWNGNNTNILDEYKEPVAKTMAISGDKVTVHYIGYFENNQIFDSNIIDWQNNNITKNTKLDGNFTYSDFAFTLGAGQVIAGFDRNVEGMNITEEKVFKIPPEEAYSSGQLANKTLYFKVKVVKIE